MKLSKESKERIKGWAKKLGKKVETLERAMDQIAGQLPNSLSDKAKETRARAILYKRVRSEVQSPAEPFEGVFIGFGNQINLAGRRKAVAREAWKKDPDTAIAEGIVDKSGTPLDMTESFGERNNPNFGNPLADSMLRTIIGVCRKDGTSDWKLTILNLRDALSDNVPYMGTGFKFRAIVKEDTKNRFVLNSSKVTKLEQSDISMTCDFFELFDMADEGVTATLGSLSEHHDENEADIQRVVFVEADVLKVPNAPNKSGGFSMPLSDYTIDPEDPPVMGFLTEEHIQTMVDFASGSHVCVIGKTGRRLEDGSMNITIYGIGAREDDRIEEEIDFNIDEE